MWVFDDLYRTPDRRVFSLRNINTCGSVLWFNGRQYRTPAMASGNQPRLANRWWELTVHLLKR
jgi:hypothetical protein